MPLCLWGLAAISDVWQILPSLLPVSRKFRSFYSIVSVSICLFRNLVCWSLPTQPLRHMRWSCLVGWMLFLVQCSVARLIWIMTILIIVVDGLRAPSPHIRTDGHCTSDQSLPHIFCLVLSESIALSLWWSVFCSFPPQRLTPDCHVPTKLRTSQCWTFYHILSCT